MNEINYDDIPSKAEQLAAVIGGTAKTSLVGVARPVLLRVPEWNLAELDAMATLANKSRNAMAVHLLDLAIEVVRDKLNDDKLSALNHEVLQRHVAMGLDTSDRQQLEV